MLSLSRVVRRLPLLAAAMNGAQLHLCRLHLRRRRQIKYCCKLVREDRALVGQLQYGTVNFNSSASAKIRGYFDNSK